MKTMRNFLPVLFLALVLGGCNKSNPVSELFTPVTLGSQPVESILTLTFSDNPVLLGDEVEITASVSPVPADGGKFRIQIALDANDNPTTTANAVNWFTLSEIEGNLASLSHLYTAPMAGIYGFRAHYIPAGSGQKQAQLTNDLIVIENCVNLNLAPTVSSVLPVTNANGTITATITVNYRLTACENLTKIKLQGGLTAGSTVMNTFPLGVEKNNRNNTVITWDNISINAGQSLDYTVTFTKTFPGPGTYNITGDWSAKNKDVTAGYNNKLSTTIE